MDSCLRQKILVTSAIYISFFASGINFNILSPTLKRLEVVFDRNSSEIARIYTLRSLGYLIGTLLGSVLFKSTSRQVSLGQLYLVVAITLGSAVVFGDFIVASILFTLNGITTGVCDVKTNVLLCQIWSNKSGAYIQAMYFSFACGCVVAPLLAGPFIAGGNIQWLFIIASVIIILSAISLFASACVFVYDVQLSESETTTHSNQYETTVDATDTCTGIIINYLSNSYRKSIEWIKISQNQWVTSTILFIALMITAYSGVEIIYWEFLPTYLRQLPMKISEEDASYMSSAIKSGLMVSRGLGIAAAAFISPRIILTFDLILLTIACVTLIYAQQSMAMIWMGNLAIASAFATIYPQIYSLVVSKFDLNDVNGAIFCFSASIMAVILPEIVADGISEDANFLILLVLVCTLLTALFFFVASSLMRKINRRINRETREQFSLESSRL